MVESHRDGLVAAVGMSGSENSHGIALKKAQIVEIGARAVLLLSFRLFDVQVMQLNFGEISFWRVFSERVVVTTIADVEAAVLERGAI